MSKTDTPSFALCVHLYFILKFINCSNGLGMDSNFEHCTYERHPACRLRFGPLDFRTTSEDFNSHPWSGAFKKRPHNEIPDNCFCIKFQQNDEEDDYSFV